MKVAIVIQSILRTDGQGRVAYEIAKAALQQGIQIFLLATSVEPELIEKGAVWMRICPRRGPGALLKGRKFVHLATRALKQNRDRFDVVHAFGYTLDFPHHVNSAQFVHAAWGKSPAHTFRVRRDLYGFYQWLYTVLNTRWEKKAFFQAQKVVACSSLVEKELTDIGIPKARIKVIENATDPEEFRPGIAERREFKLPEKVVMGLFAGDLRTPRKNLDTVLRALVHVPELHLVVIGNIEGSPYPAMAERLNIASRVHFLGFRNDVCRIMRAVDLFVFPSRYEPFGLVALEAMATGLPVIATATVGAANLISAECGIVLPDCEDAGALAAALKTLVNDPSKRLRMGKAARDIACRHNFRQMSDAFISTYYECLNAHASNPTPILQ